jgi:hypothetical protein
LEPEVVKRNANFTTKKNNYELGIGARNWLWANPDSCTALKTAIANNVKVTYLCKECN